MWGASVKTSRRGGGGGRRAASSWQQRRTEDVFKMTAENWSHWIKSYLCASPTHQQGCIVSEPSSVLLWTEDCFSWLWARRIDLWSLIHLRSPSVALCGLSFLCLKNRLISDNLCGGGEWVTPWLTSAVTRCCWVSWLECGSCTCDIPRSPRSHSALCSDYF